MEFAIGILTVIDLGLKSSKFLHDVLAGVKDGPISVQRTTTEIYGLISTLEQLAECRALEMRLLKCADDLKIFDSKLQGLTIGDSERRFGRYWKKIKTVYNEKELDKISATVKSHATALHLQLSALQRFVVTSSPNPPHRG